MNIMTGTWIVIILTWIMFHLDDPHLDSVLTCPHLDSVPLVPGPRVRLIRGELGHHVGVQETNLQKNQESIKIRIY